MAYSSLCLSMLICGVFGVSAFGKLRGRAAFERFAASVTSLAGLHGRLARVTAVGVCALEVAICLTALAPGANRFGLAAAALLLAAFTVTLVRTVRAGRRVSCNCFGASETPVSAQHVVRNALLLTAAVAGLASGSPYGHSLSAAGVSLCAFGAVVGVTVVSAFDDLMDLLRTS
ncbi:MauE/DoxX family redox-associated membrane protein [Actinospica robiniae]|uniref:MauE/DoxX family redox-associated membrane protein n=1 Tax=Actinospica robiniae TaxID=304901 RepID=UPI00041D2F9B|nr:MauE/DoxX family redox-associated membrane protein [Actinospica robiniae]